MAANVLVDASFLVALLNRRDINHSWAAEQASRFPRPWASCEPALSETFYTLGASGIAPMLKLLERRAVTCRLQIGDHLDDILKLLRKYADIPMSVADACLVRMTEVISDPVLLTTDTDFRVYRRHGRQAVPCVLPV